MICDQVNYNTFRFILLGLLTKRITTELLTCFFASDLNSQIPYFLHYSAWSRFMNKHQIYKGTEIFFFGLNSLIIICALCIHHEFSRRLEKIKGYANSL